MIDVSKFTFKRILPPCHGRLYRIFCFDVQVLAFTDSVYLQDFGQSPMDDILDDEGQMG